MKLGNVHLMLLAGIVTVSVGALTSCQKPTPQAADEAEPVPVATPIVAATIAPSTPIAVATPTPSPDPLAPPGIFFLVKKASITTDDGIIGLKPGQGVRQVGPGTYEINGRTVELRADQVTNNLRIARQFAAADAASQAALQKALQPPPATPAPAAANLAANAAAATPFPVARASSLQGNALTGSGSRLNAGSGVADPETTNRRNVKVDSSGRQYWRDSRGTIRFDF